jgi:hypothetical protein
VAGTGLYKASSSLLPPHFDAPLARRIEEASRRGSLEVRYNGVFDGGDELLSLDPYSSGRHGSRW